MGVWIVFTTNLCDHFKFLYLQVHRFTVGEKVLIFFPFVILGEGCIIANESNMLTATF